MYREAGKGPGEFAATYNREFHPSFHEFFSLLVTSFEPFFIFQFMPSFEKQAELDGETNS